MQRYQPISYAGIPWHSFVRFYGIAFTVFGVVITYVAWKVVPDEKIGVTWLIVSILFLCLLLAIFIHAYHTAYLMISPGLPKVISGHASQPPLNNYKAILRLSPSDLFSQDASVSFYLVENDGLERLLGIGVVTMIQTDGTIQVALERTFGDTEEHVNKLVVNNASFIGQVRVRPFIPRGLVGEFTQRTKNEVIADSTPTEDPERAIGSTSGFHKTDEE